MIRVFDLFCGTGGFSHGFASASPGNVDVSLGIDLLSVAIKTFQSNHGRAKAIANDIRKIRRFDVARHTKLSKGDVDVIIGGPPCQGFSSMRPFRSTSDDDPRNSLFEEFVSFVNFFRPKYFVMENVVGLATHENGNTISIIEDCFSKLGYDCDWKILNAANFGVPQKRERLIFIGVEKGGRVIFPSVSHLFSGNTIGYHKKEKVLSNIGVDRKLMLDAISVNEAIGDFPEIKSGESATYYKSHQVSNYQRERRKNSKQLTMHSATRHSEKMLEIIRHSGPNISCIPPHLITSGFSSCYSRIDGDAPSVTITVNFVHPASNRCIHPNQDRALTPREGARLQSFDDDFIFCGSRTQIVKQIGNAVPPLLGRAIGQAILSRL